MRRVREAPSLRRHRRFTGKRSFAGLTETPEEERGRRTIEQSEALISLIEAAISRREQLLLQQAWGSRILPTPDHAEPMPQGQFAEPQQSRDGARTTLSTAFAAGKLLSASECRSVRADRRR